MGVEGDLKDCREVGTREMACKWKDSYGWGILKLTFSQDFSRFDGIWNLAGKRLSVEWRQRLIYDKFRPVISSLNKI